MIRVKPLAMILPWTAAVGWLLTLTAAHAGAQVPTNPDPVEELRLVLPGQLGDATNNEALLLREKTLTERAKALRTLADLRRALALTEWKDTGPKSKLQEIDYRIRGEIGQRLMDGLQAVADKGDATSRLAAANLVGEI